MGGRVGLRRFLLRLIVKVVVGIEWVISYYVVRVVPRMPFFWSSSVVMPIVRLLARLLEVLVVPALCLGGNPGRNSNCGRSRSEKR